MGDINQPNIVKSIQGYTPEYVNCVNKLASFSINGNINDQDLSNCLDLNNKNQNNTTNPLNHNEICKLVTNKRNEKYIHTYSFDKFLPKLEKFKGNPYYQKYIDSLKEMCDTGVHDECCNCISIILYTYNNIEKLLNGYMRSIYLSVLNVEKFLPNWIVRLYLDPSVYMLIRNNSLGEDNADVQELNNIYDYISNSDNVEIYTYVCDSYSNKPGNIDAKSRVRFLRFLVFMDVTVNTSIVREADGVVTATDCNNIEYFANSDNLLYINNGLAYDAHFPEFIKFNSYSLWLKIYKIAIEPGYFSNNNNIFDMIAGFIGINIKIKESYFNEIVYYTQNNTTKLVTLSNEQRRFTGYDSFMDSSENKLLTIGFDEIFLLNLFKNIICCKISQVGDSIKYDPDNFLIIIGNILSNIDSPNKFEFILNFKLMEVRDDVLIDVDPNVEYIYKRIIGSSMDPKMGLYFKQENLLINNRVIIPNISYKYNGEDGHYDFNSVFLTKQYIDYIKNIYNSDLNPKDKVYMSAMTVLYFLDYYLPRLVKNKGSYITYSLSVYLSNVISWYRKHNINNVSLLNIPLDNKILLDFIKNNYLDFNTMLVGSSEYARKYFKYKSKYLKLMKNQNNLIK